MQAAPARLNGQGAYHPALADTALVLATHEYAHVLVAKWQGATDCHLIRHADGGWELVSNEQPRGSRDVLQSLLAGILAELLLIARGDVALVVDAVRHGGFDALRATRFGEVDVESLMHFPEVEVVAVALDMLPRLAADLSAIDALKLRWIGLSALRLRTGERIAL